MLVNSPINYQSLSKWQSQNSNPGQALKSTLSTLSCHLGGGRRPSVLGSGNSCTSVVKNITLVTVTSHSVTTLLSITLAASALDAT